MDSLAVPLSYAMARFGIETSIMVPGGARGVLEVSEAVRLDVARRIGIPDLLLPVPAGL